MGSDDVVHTALEHHAKINRESSANFRYARLQAPHREAWLNFWRTGDVILEGDEKAQIGIRYSIYQLRINASTHDDRYSVAAKGMTGFGYRGHIFHDTEIFMLPFYTYVMPEIARNLLLYRYHLLPAAREKAASNGCVGAQYPWESALDGTQINPASYHTSRDGRADTRPEWYTRTTHYLQHRTRRLGILARDGR